MFTQGSHYIEYKVAIAFSDSFLFPDCGNDPFPYCGTIPFAVALGNGHKNMLVRQVDRDPETQYGQ